MYWEFLLLSGFECLFTGDSPVMIPQRYQECNVYSENGPGLVREKTVGCVRIN